MAKRKKRQQSKEDLSSLVKVDIYYLPKEQAEMYKVLREAVALETIDWLNNKFSSVKRIQDSQEGEAIIASDDKNQEVFRFYLNPANISQAQAARDKDQLERFLENWLEKQ